MTNEHIGICIYEKGRFELRETDNAIIDLKGDFPPIMVQMEETDDGSEPQYADRRSVLHLLNELADTNPNEERHWYLKKMLDKAWTQYHEQKDENEQLKSENQQIRDTIKEMYNNERTELGKSTLKQLLEAIQ